VIAHVNRTSAAACGASIRGAAGLRSDDRAHAARRRQRPSAVPTALGLVHSDPTRAEEALQDLGDVLRYALHVQRGDDRVALREEPEFVTRYLAIERVRLGERLT